MNLQDAWEKYDDEYIQFDRVEIKFSQRRDLHAFILLDKLVPGSKENFVAAAEHDEIWLSTSPEDLEKVVTEAQIIELIRCGVRYDSSLESFCMFV